MREQLKFLRAFLQRPRRVGSVVPSSRRLAEAMLEGLEIGPSTRIAEIGPGTGAITRVLMERMPNPQLYFGIDLNERFIRDLRKKFPKAQFHAGSAEGMDKILAVQNRLPLDHVVSGLPWSLFASDLRRRTLASVTRSLSPQGTLTTFVYAHGLLLPGSREFRTWLREDFEEVQTSSVIWENMPPAVVLRASRPLTL